MGAQRAAPSIHDTGASGDPDQLPFYRMKTSRILFAVGALVLVAGCVVAIMGIRTRYSCGGDGPVYTTSRQVAEACASAVPMQLVPYEPPSVDHRWAARFIVLLATVCVALAAARLGTIARDRERSLGSATG